MHKSRRSTTRSILDIRAEAVAVATAVVVTATRRQTNTAEVAKEVGKAGKSANVVEAAKKSVEAAAEVAEVARESKEAGPAGEAKASGEYAEEAGIHSATLWMASGKRHQAAAAVMAAGKIGACGTQTIAIHPARLLMVRLLEKMRRSTARQCRLRRTSPCPNPPVA